MEIDLKKYIREIPDWPKPGIIFIDITPLLEKADVFRHLIDKLCEPYLNQKIDKIVSIDARGFLLASAVAYKLNAGISIVRKKGKLPYKTKSKDYDLEYGSNTVEIHEDTIKLGEKVVVLDDLVATGGTILAACHLVEEMHGEIVGVSYVTDLRFLGGSEKLNKYKHYSLLVYNSSEDFESNKKKKN